MQVGHSTPNIIRLIYRQDKSDPGYGMCLWADFYLDPERGSLMIMSDRGNYGYRWPEKGWHFIQVLEGMDKDYFLRKMCAEKKVDVENTIVRLREALKDTEEYTDLQIEQYIDHLKDTFEDYDLDDSPDLTGYLVTEWCDEYRIDLPDAYEYVKMGYGYDEITIAEIFEKRIRPIIRDAAEGARIRNEDTE